MTRTLLATTILSLTFSGTASANDIADFLRAVSGSPSHGHSSHRGHDRHADVHAGSHGFDHHDRRHAPVRHYTARRPVISRRPAVSFSVSFGNTAPRPRTIVVPQPILEAPPVPGSFVHLPHQVGEIVTCPVALEPHVQIKDACEVAPHAVPVIVAVRNPHLGRFRSHGCIESLVYVEVLVPPCPPQRVRVSACKTKIRLDFGEYEVDIISRNNCVVIDYDN